MTVEFDTITLPAFLASALVNGDESGLKDSDLAVLESIYKTLGQRKVIDVVRDAEGNANEARFTWSFQLYGGDAEGGDVLDYVIELNERN